MPFVIKTESLTDLTVSMMSLIFSFDIIKVNPEPEVPDPKIFLWIAASPGDASAGNSNGINTLLANDLTMLFNNSK